MYYSLLSGAYKNAGDFLIVERTIKLLEYVDPECKIDIYERSKPLDNLLDDINKTDALVLAGGPAYKPRIYPDEIPLVENLDRIEVPIYSVGLGWYGRNSSAQLLYNQYRFSDSTIKLIKRIERDGALSCRDWYTFRVLKNNGFGKLSMTGCPAWYDIDHVNETELKSEFNFPFKKICFSDPARIENFNSSLEIVKYIQNKYRNTELIYVFHRGLTQDQYTGEREAEKYLLFSEQLKQLGVKVIDISYSSEGFSVYDNCDLHIGMRVHAHIYNLSIRNPSILIEEDGRGAGVNEALGLFSIKAYNPIFSELGRKEIITEKVMRVYLRRTRDKQNPFIIQELDDYLYMLEKSNFMLIKQSFIKQRSCFDIMCAHIEKFCRK